MTARVVIMLAAVGVAAYATRLLRQRPQAAAKIAAALIGIGIAAYGLALLVADGSC
jgi:hypothetical protein